MQGHLNACEFCVVIIACKTFDSISVDTHLVPEFVLNLVEYRNTCNGPKVYVDNLMKDPNHGRLAQLWIRDCFAMAMYSGEIEWHTNATMSRLWQGKHLNLNMAWVSCSISSRTINS